MSPRILTPEEVAEIARLADAATNGPWHMSAPRSDATRQVYAPRRGPCRVVVPVAETSAQDAPFIARARTAVPDLVATIADLRAKLAAAEAELVRAQEDHRSAVEGLETYEARIRDIADHVLGLQVPDVATIVLLDAIERECGRERIARAQAEAENARLRDALEYLHEHDTSAAGVDHILDAHRADLPRYYRSLAQSVERAKSGAALAPAERKGGASQPTYAEGFADGREAAARLCERVRCRTWDANECAQQIRDDRQIPPRSSPAERKE